MNSRNKWRARYRERYYSISSFFQVFALVDFYTEVENKHYQCGNYFKTKEDAENVLKVIGKHLKEY